MPNPHPPFDLAAVDRDLAGTQFAGYLLHFPSLPSTQTLALEAAQSGARHGVWLADQQTAGRGRGGHTWHSAPNDGLYLSALVTPHLPLPSAMRLSLLTALAAQAAIVEVAGFRIPGDRSRATPGSPAIPAEIDIRWPNDLLLHGRKVGGILIESAALPASAPNRPPMLRYAVIGVGINCNQTSFPPDLDVLATSLRRESPPPAPPISREALLAAFLRHLDAELRQLVQTSRDPTLTPARDLDQYSTWLRGKPVHVPEDGGYTGVTAGLNSEGFLQVRLADGSLRLVRSGGVREFPN